MTTHRCRGGLNRTVKKKQKTERRLKMISAFGKRFVSHTRCYGRNVVMSSIQGMMTSSSQTLSLTRSFSSQQTPPAHVALAEILSGEILHEQSETEIDEDYEEIKTLITKNFKITDKAGYGNITLERTYKNEQIVVTFDCQDITEDVEDESQYDQMEEQAETQIEQGEDEEFDAPPNRYGINFEVAVTKNKSKVIFYCCSVEDRVVIQNVSFLPEGVEEAKGYAGPKYEDLDPVVRDGFQNYLAERKIDEDFAFYVLSEARNKEEREYRHWLANLVEFYSK
jgi:hypothetical protein